MEEEITATDMATAEESADDATDAEIVASTNKQDDDKHGILIGL